MFPDFHSYCLFNPSQPLHFNLSHKKFHNIIIIILCVVQMSEYVRYYWNSVNEWLWPVNKIPQTPLQKLKYCLQESRLKFETKHSDPNIVIERILMMYAELTAADNGRFNNFAPSLQTPLEFYQLSNQNESMKEEKLVSIVGQIKVSTDRVKCTLFITILLNSNIETEPPTIYVRNPDAYKMQPNPEYKGIYESVIGGVRVRPEVFSSTNWKIYSSQNLLFLLKTTASKLNENFPYVKRFKKFEHPNEEQLQTISKIKAQLTEVVPNIQTLLILKNSIESEQQHIKFQNQKLVKMISLEQQSIEPRPPNLIEVIQNEELLNLVAMQRSYEDCLHFLENKIESGEMDYQEVIEHYRNISGSVFEVRFKIKQIVAGCSQAMQQNQ